uniref:Uncharacterized protein n=1 Tax=Elizabethkingia anophelis TaxID=1117645 RepID=A0A455ZF61_9FLAO|nr:TPA_exp: hypothetical protein [Elizabethkingia anophelis]
MKIKNPANLSSAGIVPNTDQISKHFVEDLGKLSNLCVTLKKYNE